MKELKVLAVADPAVVFLKEEKDIFARFEAQTGIKLTFDIKPWTEYYPALLNSFKEYEYDIVMVAGHLWLKDFVNNNYLAPIANSFSKEYDYEDILLSIRKECMLDDNIYLVPLFCDGHMFVYRKSRVQQKFNEKITINEILDAITGYKGEGNAFTQKAHASEIFLDFLPYLRNRGQKTFDENGMMVFNNENGVKALEDYISMKEYCRDNVENNGNDEVMKDLQSGNCAMGITWGGQLGQVMNDDCKDKEDMAFSYLDTSWNVSWSFALNRLSNKEKLAIEFFEYITSKEMDIKVGDFSGNPIRKSTYENDRGEHPWYSALIKMLESAEPLENLANTGDLIGIATKEIYEAYLGNISPKAAIDNIYNNINLKD